MLEALALAFGLAMDATAIAAVRGLANRRSEAVLLPLLFGLFQAGMSALGWAAGAWGGKYIEAWDHWIAAGLLFAIGGKLFLDAWKDARSHGEAEDEAAHADEPTSAWLLLGLAVATSIDAAAAGLTLPLLPVAPGLAIAVIGVVTLACSVAGFAAGRVAGKHLGTKLSIVGGVLLIAIGVRVLAQHL